MATLVFGYLMFEKEDDFTSNVKNWQDRLFVQGGSITQPDQYPAFFHYHDSGDPHCYGTWVPCTGFEMVRKIQRESEALIDLQAKILDLLPD